MTTQSHDSDRGDLEHWRRVGPQLEFNRSFCIISGLAVVYWGTPRSTQDVDVSLVVPLGDERAVAEHLLHSFTPRIEQAVPFAVESRILLIEASNGVSIYIAFAGFPLEQAMIERAEMCELQPGLSVRLINAEDLIISKAIAARPQDVLDIQGIIDRQGEHLDRTHIRLTLEAFCSLLETNDPIQLVDAMRNS